MDDRKWPRAGLAALAAAALLATTHSPSIAKRPHHPKHSSTHTTANSSTSTTTQNPTNTLTRAEALSYINQLQLGAQQLRFIVDELDTVETATHDYDAAATRALKPVQASVHRIRLAVLNGQQARPYDIARVNTALAPLNARQVRLNTEWANAIRAIRDNLTRAQLDVLRSFMGYPAAGTVGAVAPAYGTGAFVPVVASPTQVLTLLDWARTLPLVTYDNNRGAIASQLVAAEGISLASPQYAAARLSMGDMLDSIRSLSFGDYESMREGMAYSIAQSGYQAAMQGFGYTPTIDTTTPADVQADNDSVNRFFFREDILHALRARRNGTA